MPRYFIAIPLPDEARGRLIAVPPPDVPGARLLGREELHLTLHFLGEVDARKLDMVRAALATVKVNAFPIALKGIGKFPPEGQAQVLWVGVEANAALMALHHSIGAALADAIGFRVEKRPYSPHVTLARLNEPAPPEVIHAYLEAHSVFALPSVPLDRFVLYSSEFAGNVPRYREEEVFPFTGSAADHIDQYVARKGLVPLLTDGDWEAFVAYVLHLYGPQLWHRSRRVTQQDELFQRYSSTFPHGLAKPYRHLRSVELLVSDSPRLDELREWLTCRGVKFDPLVEDTGEDGGGEVVGIRVLGFQSGSGG